MRTIKAKRITADATMKNSLPAPPSSVSAPYPTVSCAEVNDRSSVKPVIACATARATCHFAPASWTSRLRFEGMAAASRGIATSLSTRELLRFRSRISGSVVTSE